jgi:hypothetical protein
VTRIDRTVIALWLSTPWASSCSARRTGSSQSGTVVAISQPAATEPAASSISGTVMISGDSCGCSMSSVQRAGPWNVSTNSRVM